MNKMHDDGQHLHPTSIALRIALSRSLALFITRMRNEESSFHRSDCCTSDRFCQHGWVGAATHEAERPVEQRSGANFEPLLEP